MERYSEVLGLPVICAVDGKKLGVINDIIFCPKDKEVKAFLLERKGYELGRKVVLLPNILNLGKDALVVNDYSCVEELRKYKNAKEFIHKGEVKGLRIYTRSGSDLGVVKDILFDYKTGIIEGVEISDGLLQDIIKGRNILPLFGRVEFGEESIIVEKEAIEEMMSTGGGLEKILHDE